jgi:CMP-N-acetylneuraminic acid synthetase
MTSTPVHVFLPCRAGSQRVPKKNTRAFAGIPGGLLELKLIQLSQAKTIASVVISTDDPKVMEIAERCRGLFSISFEIIERPHELAIADSLDKFVAYVPSIMSPGVVLWTHVTSPFFSSHQIDHAVQHYRSHVEKGPYDSLMGVTRIQTFLWNETGCISHDREQVKWPQTQDITPIFEVNSSVFMISRDEMLRRCDRIGDRPYLMETVKLDSCDVDCPDDVVIAEKSYEALGDKARALAQQPDHDT